MKIYSASGVELIDLVVSDESYRYRSIMGENALTLTFSLSVFTEIPVGSYADFQGERFTLLKPQNFKKNNSRNFEYTLILQSAKSLLGLYKFKDSTSKRLKFPYTAQPQEHLEMVVWNLNQRDSGWSVGTCVSGVEQVLNYNHTNCDEALRMIAEAFKTEYEVINKVISLKKVEYNKTLVDALPLSYGFGNGFKSGVKRDNFDNSKAIEVLFVQGGEKNIDATAYGSSEMLLPKSQTLRYDGIKFENETGFIIENSRQYVVDENGYYIMRNDKALSSHIEDSLDCSHIYPQRVGTVSSVVVVNVDNNFYDFIDSSIPANLDYNDCLIKGEKMTVIFQSGMLAGKEFDISSYNHGAKKFQIVPQDIDGVTMPNESFKPVDNDKYAIFGINLPTAYVCDNISKTGGSWDMFREAVKYFYENENPRFSFTGELDPIWAKSDWINVGGKIKLGGYVAFRDDQFQDDAVLIRIVGIKDFINNPHSPQIELSNIIVGGNSLSSALGVIEQNEVAVETKNKEVIRFAKRGFNDAQETARMLQNSMLNFSGAINPVTVQTMQLLVGDESLQFEFVANQNSTAPIPHNETFNPATKQFTSAAGIIQHKTLGITDVSSSRTASDYKWWSLPEYVSAVLDQQGKSYYLYAKVSKTNNTGTFILSETAIAIEQVSGFYHLLVGILNSENDGDRSYSPMYGYSELTPGRLMIKKLISPSGNVYFDLDKGNGDGEIAGNIKFRASDNSLKSVEQAIDEVQVGGTNLMQNSKTPPSDRGAGTVEINLDGTWDAIDCTSYNLWFQPYMFRPETYYTVSLKCKRIDGEGAAISVYFDAENDYEVIPGTNNISSEYVVYKITRKTSSTPATSPFISFIFPFGRIRVEYIKVEKGNKATDWSPNPKDVDASILVAKNAADAANAEIGNITSDGVFDKAEKISKRQEWEIIAGEKVSLNNQATNFGIQGGAANVNFNAAFTTLANYLNAGATWVSPQIPFWISDSQLAVNTTINAATFRANYKAYYDAKIALMNAISTRAKQSGDDASVKVDNLKPAGKNYLINSRTDSLSGWSAFGGTMSVVADANYGNVVEYSRPAGGGDFMKMFSIDTSELKNTDLIYYCIAKPISGTTVFNFGGWSETFDKLKNTSPYRNLGNGWRLYYGIFASGNNINSGGTFGLNSVGGTWRFHSFGVAKGNTPPADWDASPKEIDFLKQGYKASTDIQGGVVQTAILLLRNALEQVTAGISGLEGDGVINWGAGTYQQAIDDAAKAFGAAMTTAFLNKEDGSGHLAFGKIAWNNAGQLIVDGIIKAIGGKLGLFDISQGNILGFDANGSQRIKLTTTAIETLANLASSGWIFLPQGDNLNGESEGVFDNDTPYNENFMQTLTTTTTFTIPYSAKVIASSQVGWEFSNPSAVISDYTEQSAVFKQGGSVVATAVNSESFVNLTAGTYTVEIKSTLYATLLGQSVTNFSLRSDNAMLRYEGAIKQTSIGLNGLYSLFSAAEYFHFREGSGLSVRGATDIPAGLGGATVSYAGSVSGFWGKIALSNQISKSSNTISITHNIGDTNYTVMAVGVGVNVTCYAANKQANSVQVIVSGTFNVGTVDIVLKRTV